jgi:tight adherence protein C
LHVSRQKQGSIEAKLKRAGNPWGINPMEFVILKIGFAVVGLVFGAGTYYLIYSSISFIPWYVYVIAFTIVGFLLPDYDLKKKGDARMAEFQKQLPDALDILNIQATVNKSLPSCFQAIAPRLEPGLVKDELTVVASDISSGRKMENALKAFADRAPSTDVEAFVNVIIQASAMHTDPAEALRERAQTTRDERIARIDKKIASLSSRIMIYLSPTMIMSLVLVAVAPSLQTTISALGGSL